MRRAVVMLAAILSLALTGCSASSSSPGSTSTEQQDALSRLVLDAGYKITGVPHYEGARWLVSVRVSDCRAKVELAGNNAPEQESSTSFTVLKVGGAAFDKLSPGTDAKNMPADTLKFVQGIEERLDCL